ncbi:MAG: replication-relaxation family protein, partial [Ktedonobacteraceae bacterium]
MMNSAKKAKIQADGNAQPVRGRLTERDIALFEYLYEMPGMIPEQINKLLFPKPYATQKASSRCLHRLTFLARAGFLQPVEQLTYYSQGKRPFRYFLREPALSLVAQRRGIDLDELDWNPKDTQATHDFQEHRHALHEVRIGFILAARQHSATIEQWIDERMLKRTEGKVYVTIKGAQGAAYKIAVIADGFCRLKMTTDKTYTYYQFIELDRSTETGQPTKWSRNSWQRKILGYNALFTPGGQGQPSVYQQRYGGTEKGRVLTITTGDKRLANLKRITEQNGGKSKYWFTTLEAIKTNDILTDPIWQKAGSEGKFRLTW